MSIVRRLEQQKQVGVNSGLGNSTEKEDEGDSTTKKLGVSQSSLDDTNKSVSESPKQGQNYRSQIQYQCKEYDWCCGRQY